MDERLRLLESELDSLFELIQLVNRPLNLHDTLTCALKVVHERAGLDMGLIALVDSAGGLLVHAAQGSIDLTQTDRCLSKEGMIGAVFQFGKTAVVERPSQEPELLNLQKTWDANLPLIVVPIRQGEEVLGILAVQLRLAGHLLSEYVRFLEAVAALLAQSKGLSQVGVLRRSTQDARDRQRDARGEYGWRNLVGTTPAMRKVFEQVRQVAKWNTTVLIRGESGTGKELIAHAIHYNSPRAGGPFVKLNCAALPDTLLESELFGHEKGAFTGASSQREGRFKLADGGTLFLDEIGEISPAFQAKLLRVLQEGEFERVGGSQTLHVDVRIIAATNRDLEAAVESGAFREDLYYRLNVMPIQLPPLRERIEDIPVLAKFLVEKIGRKQNRELSITDSAIRLLMRHNWPGNVRELENIIERAAVLCQGSVIDRDAILESGIKENLTTQSHPPHTSVNLNDPNLEERERVIAALEQAGWVQAKAARLLGMSPRQIAYRIQTLKIRVRKI
ncbi:MAG: nif-specific transcriptional activator NifA [Methylohalobius sp.]|nr:nif-specific transcriptional activator NifA [Methylohalobius sp.]